MKFYEIVTMMNSGIGSISSNQLSIKSAYIVTQFKREVDRLYNDWLDRYNRLPKEAGIEDGEAFDKRRAELTTKVKKGKLNNTEAKELDGLNEKWNRLQGLRSALSDEDITINSKALSYEDWFTLKSANNNIKTGNAELLELLEVSLENILWKAPDEAE